MRCARPNEFREERLATVISITSTGTSDCKYTTALRNRSRGVSFGDFSEIDFLVSYDLTTGDSTRRLAYTSEWTVSSITGDNTNPNVWDPEETATFSFSLAPEPKVGTKGTIAVAVPGGISDSAYFDVVTCFYWHNYPTPPTGDTASHAPLSMDRIAPLASTLYNYDTDRDTDPGLQLKKSKRGLSETDPLKYQVWRTASLGDALVITGDVSIDFWAALTPPHLGERGTVNMYLRDYDGVSAYTEIGSGTISESDWQGASTTFVKKTITIPGLNYTVVAGHELELKVVVDNGAQHDMWFAYDTVSYPSVIKLP